MVVVEQFSTSGSIKSSLDYNSNPRKLGKMIAIGCSPSHVERDMELPFKVYGKENDSVKAHKFVISFANIDGNSELNDYDSSEYVRKFLTVVSKSLGDDFPIAAYQHLNRDHNHYHVILGACGNDGKKFHPKQNPISFCRRLNDRLSLSYGLRLLPTYNRSYKSIKQYTDEQVSRYAQNHNGSFPYSYKDDGRQKISRALLRASSLEGFKKSMLDQGCDVSSNLFSDTKMLSIAIPFSYKNFSSYKSNYKHQDFRNIRTQTLSKKYFSKAAIKRAIYSKDKSFLKPYKFFARDMKTVQGGKYEHEYLSRPAILVKHPAKVRMRNVPHVSDRRNHIHALSYGRDYFHDSGVLDIMQPNLAGLDSEEKHEMISQYKAYEEICKNIDRFFNNASSIFHIFSHSIFRTTNNLLKSKNQDMSFVYDSGVGNYSNYHDSSLNISSNKISNNFNSNYIFRARKIEEEKRKKIKERQEIDPLAGITNADLDKYKTPAEKQAATNKKKNIKNSSSKFLKNNEVKNNKRKRKHTYHGPSM